MTSLDRITVNPEGGNSKARLTIGKEQRIRPNTSGSTNDLNGLEKATSEPKSEEDRDQDGNLRDGSIQKAQPITDGPRGSQPNDNSPGGINDRTLDFMKKRNADLNIILIVAGLFSPVISAFVIYIHPQLQQNPDKEKAALLRVTLYEMDNTVFGGDIPKVPKWLGPPPTVVASLVLLYLSFIATMAAVLFSISAKRLLNLYTSASRLKPKGWAGDIFRLILRWFALCVHWVVIFLSFLLQIAFLVFSCGLAVYIWGVNLLTALFVLVLTICAIPIIAFHCFVSIHNLGLPSLS